MATAFINVMLLTLFDVNSCKNVDRHVYLLFVTGKIYKNKKNVSFDVI